MIPIERYAQSRRDDGLPFDPWIRVHTGLGGSLLRPEPRSMEIKRPVREWEEWVAMQFPEDGDYVFPGGLAPLSVSQGTGCYWEPKTCGYFTIPRAFKKRRYREVLKGALVRPGLGPQLARRLVLPDSFTPRELPGKEVAFAASTRCEGEKRDA